MIRWQSFICAAMGMMLFGAVVSASKPKLGTCSLPIVVRATLLADGAPEWSTAMIYHRDRKASQSYTINSGSNELESGVFLREIHKLWVVIENRGKLERCTGEAHQFTGTGDQTNSLSNEPVTIGGAELPSRMREIFAAFGDAEKAGVAGIGGAARPGVKAAWTDKFSVPGISGGPHGPRAFQVGRLQKDSIYYRLGIRNFDVVRSVNGHSFGSPKQATALMEKLGDASSLVIQVLRRGKLVNIDVNLN